jgi:SAM-dependent methyltransferase
MPDLDDRAYLLGDQYRGPDKLQARIALHARFSTQPQPWPRWVFDPLARALAPAARVLEVGCGPGTLWMANRDRLPPGCRVTLTDLSPGMVEAARAAIGSGDGEVCFTFAVADVQALPMAAASFDAVIANHMLYHVPDRPRACAELRRVLRPGGLLCAALNGRAHLRELWDFAAALAPGAPAPLRAEERLPLEDAAEEFAPFFESIEVRWRPDTLRVTEVAPLLAYLASDWRFEHLPPATLAAAVQERLAAGGGVWEITKSSGVVLARRPA